MSNVKKAFVELHAFLEANQDKKIKSVLAEITEMCTARGAGGAATSLCRNEAGELVGILDYYFKVWLPIDFVEFGSKAGSASGLNTMCKLGTSLWTKQQRDYKKGKETLLDQVAAGEVQPTDIQERLNELEVARQSIVAYPVPGLAFDSAEDLLAADPVAMQAALDEYNAEQERLAAEAAEQAAEEEAAVE